MSHARNCGARAADGDLILICDADDRVRTDVGAEDGRGQPVASTSSAATSTPGTLNDVETRSWRNPFSPSAARRGMLNHLPFAVGANVGVTRACFEAIDGWREEYICGGDDVDFSWRAQQAGFRLGMAPGAVIDYRYRAGAHAPCTASSSATGWPIRSSTSTTGRRGMPRERPPARACGPGCA